MAKEAVIEAPPPHIAKMMSEVENDIHGDRKVDDGAKATPEGEIEVKSTDKNPDDVAVEGEIEVKSTDKNPDDVAVVTDDDTEFVIDINDIETTKEGKLVFRIDKDDPESSFYTGKDSDELFANIRKGFKDTKAALRASQAKEKIELPEETVRKVIRGPKEEAVTTDEPIPEPVEADIIAKHCKAAKIGTDVLNWSAEQWNRFAEEKHIQQWQVMEARSGVKAVQDAANAEIAQKRAEYDNGVITISETREVIDLLSDSKIDIEKFDIEAILNNVASDEKNYDARGRLKPGRIVSVASREIQKLTAGRTRGALEKEINRTIAEGEEAKRHLDGSGGVRIQKGTFKGTKHVPKSTEEALQMILKEERAKQRGRDK